MRAEDQPRTAPSGWVLASLSLAMLLSSLGTSIANVALPTLSVAFAASFQRVQWIVLAYLLAITTLIVSAGRLGDVVGRRRMLLTGIALFAAASIACGTAPALWVMIAARGMQGAGAALMMALAMSCVADLVPRERMGGTMGLLGTMSAVGTALGPSLGGVLIAGLGWRAIFLVNVPLAILAFVLAHRHLPRDSAAGRAQGGFDLPGTALLAAGLGAFALAMTIGRGSFGPVNLGLVLLAGLSGWLFVRIESNALSPLIRLAMFRDSVLRAGLVSGGLVASVMMATLVVGPFYLVRALGLGPGATGLAMSVGPIVAAFAGVPAGRFADRFGAQRMAIAGLAGIGAGALALSLMPVALGVAGYVAPMVVMTMGYATFQAANNSVVMAGVGAADRGVVSGLLNLARNLGLVTGAAVLGAVFALAAGASDVATARPEDVATGMRVTFAVGGVLIGVALAVITGWRPAVRRPAIAPTR